MPQVKAGRNRKLLALAAAVFFGIVFFAAALSSLDLPVKALLMLADLVASTYSICQLLQVPSFYGLVFIKGKYGLKLMQVLAERYSGAFTQMADLGLSVSFGIIYSYLLFWRKGGKLKWAAHSAFIIAFFYFATSTPNALQFVDWRLMFLAGVLGGFGGLTLLMLAASAVGVVAAKTSPASVTLAIPGITLPLYQGILALIVVLLVHEMSHGVLANINKVKVNFSGLFLLGGFLPLGGMVEPDERQFPKAEIWKKRRILIAGTASNFCSFMLLLPLALLLSMLMPAVSGGVLAGAIPSNGPGSGLLSPGDQIISINGVAINSTADALDILQDGGQAKVLTQRGTITVNASYLLVQKIEPGSPSDGALRPGDRLLKVAGRTVGSVAALQGALATQPIGRNFTVLTGRGAVTVFKAANGHIGISILEVPAFDGQQAAKPGWQLAFDMLVFIITTVYLTALLSLALAAILDRAKTNPCRRRRPGISRTDVRRLGSLRPSG